MPNLFAITTATNSVTLDEERRGRVTFTVTNTSDAQMQACARVKALDPNTRDWFYLAEDPERSFATGETTQYTVQITIPAGAPAGWISFRLDVVGVENPDEDYTEGPSVRVVVPEKEEEPRPFPWWILAVAAGVLMVGVTLAIVLWPREVPVPNVRGMPEATAVAMIEAAGLAPAVEEWPNPASVGEAVGTTPEANKKVRRGSGVNLIISAGQTATPSPTSTPTATPTFTPTSTPTSTPTPTPTSPSQQRVKVTVDKFVCRKSDDEGPGNLVDMDRFRVLLNAYQRASMANTPVQINSPDAKVGPPPGSASTVYSWATSGARTMDRGEEHLVGKSLVLTFDTDTYDFELATLQVIAYARDYDPTSANEEAWGDVEYLGSEMFADGGQHGNLHLYSDDFEFQVWITITKLPSP